jgi:hypothetical protein
MIPVFFYKIIDLNHSEMLLFFFGQQNALYGNSVSLLRV